MELKSETTQNINREKNSAHDCNISLIEKDGEFIKELATIFDMLARFDFEDKQKEKLALNSGLLVSAPRESEFGSNFKN